MIGILLNSILPFYLFTFLGVISGSVESGGCEDNWVLEGNHCYYFSTDTNSWNASEDYCRSKNAYLVKIETENENDFLTRNMQANRHIWIGLYEKEKEKGTWVWTSDNTSLSNSNYIHWNEGEPNDSKPNRENCGSFFKESSGYWNDLPCYEIVHYICEGPQQKDIQYRIRIKAAQHHPNQGYVVLKGNWNKEVRMQLNITVSKYDGLRVGEVTSNNIGTVTNIQYQPDAALYHTKYPEFVSIYKSDNDGFYIKRFDKNTNVEDQTQNPCVRHFGKALKLIISDTTGLETVLFTEVKDETDCKLRCIESDTFDCRLAYYSTSYRACHIIKQESIKDHFSTTDREDVFVFERADNC